MIERSPFYGKIFDVTLITKGRPVGRFGALVSDAFCSSESKSQTIWPYAMGIARKRDAHRIFSGKRYQLEPPAACQPL